MKLTLDNEKEIMEYLSGLKSVDEKYRRLEELIKSIINHLPKRNQRQIEDVLKEEYKK
jgi:hypothetical protein